MWKKSHNENLHNLCCSPHIIRVTTSGRMRWAGHLAREGEMRKSYEVLVGNSEGNRPFGKPWQELKWKDNIKVEFKDMVRACELD